MIKFYSINYDYRTIGKLNNYIPVFELDVPLKHSTDLIKPTLVINSENNLQNINYCYIDTFERYYFIDKVETIRNNMYKINCTVDVLESFRMDILNIVDVDFQNSVQVVQAVKHSTNTPLENVSYVLTTIGG